MTRYSRRFAATSHQPTYKSPGRDVEMILDAFAQEFEEARESQNPQDWDAAELEAFEYALADRDW